jgi:hypothetical protein
VIAQTTEPEPPQAKGFWRQDPRQRQRKVSPMFGNKENPAPKLVKNSNEYVAFHGKDKTHRLEIFMANESAQAPEYKYLLNITFNHKEWTDFVLTYSIMLGSYRS